jgi:hypothetical protein
MKGRKKEVNASIPGLRMVEEGKAMAENGEVLQWIKAHQTFCLLFTTLYRSRYW